MEGSIKSCHTEKTHIASGVTAEDRMNETMRVNMNYKPKMTITHDSSVRYRCNPKDNKLW